MVAELNVNTHAVDMSSITSDNLTGERIIQVVRKGLAHNIHSSHRHFVRILIISDIFSRLGRKSLVDQVCRSTFILKFCAHKVSCPGQQGH